MTHFAGDVLPSSQSFWRCSTDVEPMLKPFQFPLDTTVMSCKFAFVAKAWHSRDFSDSRAKTRKLFSHNSPSPGNIIVVAKSEIVWHTRNIHFEISRKEMLVKSRFQSLYPDAHFDGAGCDHHPYLLNQQQCKGRS